MRSAAPEPPLSLRGAGDVFSWLTGMAWHVEDRAGTSRTRRFFGRTDGRASLVFLCPGDGIYSTGSIRLPRLHARTC
jgi:hypothetical protein